MESQDLRPRITFTVIQLFSSNYFPLSQFSLRVYVPTDLDLGVVKLLNLYAK